MLQGLNLLVSLTILTVLFAMIFKFMPSAPIAWRDVWTGAAVTAVLFEIGKVLIGLYLGKSGVNESFAAAGSLVVLLAWVYYAAQIFLLGAEFTKVYAHAHGSVAASKAQAATQETARQAEAGTDDVERTPRRLREPSEAHAAVERKELIVAIASRVIVVAGLAMLRSLLSGRRRTSRARHRRGPT